MIPIDTQILALAGAGLPGARALPRDGWSDRLDDVANHGLTGLLAWADAEGLVDLGDAGAHRLELRLEQEAIRAVQLEGELIRLQRILTDLPAVVLKGAVLAHGAYPDPSLRPFTDLDILVSGRQHGSAVRALEAQGYERGRPEPAPGYDARVGKALQLVHPGGVVIDLHRTLVAGRLADSIDVDEILSERRLVLIGGVAIPGPSWEAHLVETALHAVMGDGLARALSIRDVAQLCLHPDLDAERAVEMIRRWKATDPVSNALRAVVDGIGIDLPEPFAALAGRHPTPTPLPPPPTRSAKRRIDELLRGNVGRRITLTRALVAPSPAFMRWNYGADATPRLYGRRWLELYHRTLDARADPRADGPAGIVDPPPGSPEPAVSLPPPTPVAARSHRQRPASPPLVALAPRSPVAHVARPHGEPSAPGRAGGRLHPRPRSRQQRWSDKRAGQGAAAHGGGAPPPSPGSPDVAGAAEPDPTPIPDSRRDAAAASPPISGMRHGLGGVGLLVLTAIGAQIGIEFLGLFLVPAAAFLFAIAATRRITRLRPDEDWIGRFLILGVAVKIGMSYLRYLTLTLSYDSQGDAIKYDEFGRQFAEGWRGGGIVPQLDNLRKTNFIRWFTGVVYFVFGSNVVAGFFIFGLLALVGSYLWYRACVDAVPGMNKRLYLGLVLFMPSIVFWPSSIGKESLMQFGIGVAALGTSFILRKRMLLGLAIGCAGGWLLWVVRPHLLALVTIAAGVAYLAGRVRGGKKGVPSFVGRPVGIIVIALLMAFAVSQATKSLGISELSLSSVQSELDNVSKQTGQGGSKFETSGDSLSPLNLPNGAVTVLLRPLPFEVHTPFEALAALESMLVLGLMINRFSSARTAFRRARTSPFLLYCIILLILYAATFSSFANFGILVRQRSLVMPALFVLFALNPEMPKPRGERALSEPASTGPGPEGPGPEGADPGPVPAHPGPTTPDRARVWRTN